MNLPKTKCAHYIPMQKGWADKLIKLKLADENLKSQLKIEHNAYIAYVNDEMLGFCEFECQSPVGKLYKIKCDDIPLIDGLLRQTLFFLAEKMCLTAELTAELSNKLSALYMIKPNQTEIKIAEFFSTPCH